MDRISALRNIEAALREYEDGELDLAELEERVGTVLRTYATAFEAEDLDVYRASGGVADGTIVAAADETTARELIRERFDEADLEFEVDHLG
ncbi:MAG: hypothetical protein ABEJ57_01015 [Halobacteriaceae archaeon]